METKIEGGKLFINGVEVKLKKDGGVLVGDGGLLISAGEIHSGGNWIKSLTPEEWNELKGGEE